MDDTAGANARLKRLIDGFKVSAAIYVFVTTGVADLLAAGTPSSDELAGKAGLDAPSLYRLLRALAAAGVVEELNEKRFRLSPVGELLRSDTPGSLAGWAELMGSPTTWQNWGNLAGSVRTGKTGYQLLQGTDAWTYRLSHPADRELFDRAMVSSTGAALEPILQGYDFSRFRTMVDVGGGRGAFLGALLARHASMTGVLFDLPEVVAGAGEVLSGFGVHERCRIESGSFFEAVPADGDAYVLKSVIHDWYDADALRILAACRRSMPSGATLLLVERVLAPPNEGLESKLSDLNMLVNPGGIERTVAEFGALLAQAGFHLERHIPTTGSQDVLEAVPV
jgi:O-methyltransferase